MIRFTVYPSSSGDTHTVSFEDLGATKDIWEQLSEASKQMALLQWAERNHPIEWKLDLYNDEVEH